MKIRVKKTRKERKEEKEHYKYKTSVTVEKELE